MRKKFYTLILLIILSIATQANDKLASFTLEDQFKVLHSQNEFLGKKSIVILGSTDTVELRKSFIKELEYIEINKIHEVANIVNIFDMSHVPSLLKFYARGKFPKEKEKWILVDWEGLLTKTYNSNLSGLTILLCDKKGFVLDREFITEINQESMKRISNKLKEMP